MSYETLTSKSTHKALHAYLKQDSIFAEEIRARLGDNAVDSLPDDIPVGGRREEEDLDGDIDGDDTDVVLTDVIRTALGDGLANPPHSNLEVSMASKNEDGDGLVAANEEDDIWAYNDQGVKWKEVGMAGETEGGAGDESDDSNE